MSLHRLYALLWKEAQDLARTRAAVMPALLMMLGKFSGKTPEEFMDAVWRWFSDEKFPNTLADFFNKTFKVSEDFATKFGLTELIHEARLWVRDLDNYRIAQYKGRKIYLNTFEGAQGEKGQAIKAEFEKMAGRQTDKDIVKFLDQAESSLAKTGVSK